MHDASDLLAVAEMMKSRNLLDEMGGCGIEPSTPAGWNDDAGEDPATPDRSELHTMAVEWAAQGLDPDEFRQLAMISYWPVFDAGLQSRLNTRDEQRYGHYLKTEQKLLEAEDGVVASHGGFEGFARPAAPEEIRDALRDDELFIEFFIPRDPFSPNRYCWIICATRSGIVQRNLYFEPSTETASVHSIKGVLIERGPLADIAAKTRAEILSRNDDQARSLLNRLFNSLLGEIINAGLKPENFRRWIIVPHGPLHLVPLHALVDNNGRHLIERVAITTAPSGSAWLRMLRQKRGPVERLLAVGNPRISADLPELPEAEAEVVQIPDHAPWLRSKTILTGSHATESRVRAELPRVDIVHFATHTEFDWKNPRDAHRILLAGDSGHDGFLLASELRGMDLSNLRLAVLNTCNGAVCRYGPGDEPLGLLASFISSGAENILGALWELRDTEAKRFILDFYKMLALGDPAIALQSACCLAIENKRHIADWAGIPLVGAGRPFA
jgi:CHAT domain-containing protein